MDGHGRFADVGRQLAKFMHPDADRHPLVFDELEVAGLIGPSPQVFKLRDRGSLSLNCHVVETQTGTQPHKVAIQVEPDTGTALACDRRAHCIGRPAAGRSPE